MTRYLEKRILDTLRRIDDYAGTDHDACPVLSSARQQQVYIAAEMLAERLAMEEERRRQRPGVCSAGHDRGRGALTRLPGRPLPSEHHGSKGVNGVSS